MFLRQMFTVFIEDWQWKMKVSSFIFTAPSCLLQVLCDEKATGTTDTERGHKEALKRLPLFRTLLHKQSPSKPAAQNSDT